MKVHRAALCYWLILGVHMFSAGLDRQLLPCPAGYDTLECSHLDTESRAKGAGLAVPVLVIGSNPEHIASSQLSLVVPLATVVGADLRSMAGILQVCAPLQITNMVIGGIIIPVINHGQAARVWDEGTSHQTMYTAVSFVPTASDSKGDEKPPLIVLPRFDESRRGKVVKREYSAHATSVADFVHVGDF